MSKLCLIYNPAKGWFFRWFMLLDFGFERHVICGPYSSAAAAYNAKRESML